MENRIRQLREEHHMTQIRLSIELEVAQETISAYESGKHHPSIPTLIKMSQIFNASCDYILGLSDFRSRDYVLSDRLSSEEHTIIESYRALPFYKQELFKAYLQGLSEK